MRILNGSLAIIYGSLIFALCGCEQGKPGVSLIGAGSSFDNPLFSKMFYEYYHARGLKVNYQSIGSGGGISQLINRTIDFGASDVPMNAEQDSIAPDSVVHLPITASAVVLSYNLPEVKDTLQLSPEALSGIFLGKITHWNDPVIAACNPGLRLPSTPVVIAHRSDGSGTSHIFTSYLAAISPEWQTRVGKGSSVNWPAGLGGKGNEGVAGMIRQTQGAIGYVELAFAMQSKMPSARIRNKAGNYIAPAIASITAAANVPIPRDGKISLEDTNAPDGYPIAAFSWVLLYKEQGYRHHSPEKAREMLRLLSWMIHDGQQFSGPLYYAALSPAAVSTGEAILGSVTYDGRKILSDLK